MDMNTRRLCIGDCTYRLMWRTQHNLGYSAEWRCRLCDSTRYRHSDFEVEPINDFIAGYRGARFDRG